MSVLQGFHCRLVVVWLEKIVVFVSPHHQSSFQLPSVSAMTFNCPLLIIIMCIHDLQMLAVLYSSFIRISWLYLAEKSSRKGFLLLMHNLWSSLHGRDWINSVRLSSKVENFHFTSPQYLIQELGLFLSQCFEVWELFCLWICSATFTRVKRYFIAAKIIPQTEWKGCFTECVRTKIMGEGGDKNIFKILLLWSKPFSMKQLPVSPFGKTLSHGMKSQREQLQCRQNGSKWT